MRPVLLDLDGTLHHSAPIIIDALEDVVREKLGEEHPREFYFKFIGPPLGDIMRKLGGEDRVEEFSNAYAERYRSHMLETPLNPGMGEMLQTLDAAGVPLATATSKYVGSARAILEKQGVAKHFKVIAGASERVRGTGKAAVIADALSQLKELGVDTSSALMVGDRKYDVEGGIANGVPTVLVGWGDTPEEEYKLPWRVVDDPKDLTELLLAFSRGEINPTL